MGCSVLRLSGLLAHWTSAFWAVSCGRLGPHDLGRIRGVWFRGIPASPLTRYSACSDCALCLMGERGPVSCHLGASNGSGGARDLGAPVSMRVSGCHGGLCANWADGIQAVWLMGHSGRGSLVALVLWVWGNAGPHELPSRAVLAEMEGREADVREGCVLLCFVLLLVPAYRALCLTAISAHAPGIGPGCCVRYRLSAGWWARVAQSVSRSHGAVISASLVVMGAALFFGRIGAVC